MNISGGEDINIIIFYGSSSESFIFFGNRVDVGLLLFNFFGRTFIYDGGHRDFILIEFHNF